MKFIAGLRVWGNWEIGENVLKVFLRLRGSANRRVDLFLPLIASIPGHRGRDIGGLAMLGAGTQTSSAHSGSGSPTRGMKRADPEPNRRVSTRCRRKSGEWLGRVASGQ